VNIPTNQTTQELALETADKKRIAADAEATVLQADAVRIGAAQYTEERDLANQLLGQAQMAQAISKIADVSALLKLKYVKENKLYRHMCDKENADGRQFLTWAGYCKMLGTSSSAIDEDLMNLSTLGEEALSEMQRIGLGTRELRKLRKLPEEERNLVISGEAVDVSDKDAVVELIEDLAGRSAKLKEELQAQQAKLNEDREIAQALQAQKNSRIEELATELHRTQGRSMPWDERVRPLSAEINMVRNTLAECFGKLHLMHAAILNMPADNDPEDRALLHLCTMQEDVIIGAAQNIGELQAMFDMEMSGIVETQRQAVLMLGDDLDDGVDADGVVGSGHGTES